MRIAGRRHEVEVRRVAIPYRLFALYEKTGADWKLVHANFTYIVAE